MSTTSTQTHETEGSILARILSNKHGTLPPEVARYLLDAGFSEEDKARMHELAVRNQEGTISPSEKAELLAFVNAGSVLSLLKAKARRTLKIKPKKKN
jgi:hypothetical protein